MCPCCTSTQQYTSVHMFTQLIMMRVKASYLCVTVIVLMAPAQGANTNACRANRKHAYVVACLIAFATTVARFCLCLPTRRAITQVRHSHWKRNSSDPHWILSFVNRCVQQKRSLCGCAEKGLLWLVCFRMCGDGAGNAFCLPLGK